MVLAKSESLNDIPINPELGHEARDGLVTSLNRCIRYINGEEMHTGKGKLIVDETLRTEHFKFALEHIETLTTFALKHSVVVTDNGNSNVVLKTLVNFRGEELRDEDMMLIYGSEDYPEEFSLKGLGTEFKVRFI